MRIKELILVEGKDDVAAVKAAVDAEVIITGGTHISHKTWEIIKEAYQRQGIIVLTDPDYAGKKIRSLVTQVAPQAKHAFIGQNKALKKGDIGVENASPEVIRDALAKAHAQTTQKELEFTPKDLTYYGLTGLPSSKKRRIYLGEVLGIGYGNGKQIIKKLNAFGISRQELEKALEEEDK